MTISIKKIFVFEKDPFEHYRVNIYTDIITIDLLFATKDNKLYAEHYDESGPGLVLIGERFKLSKSPGIYLSKKLIAKVKTKIELYQTDNDAIYRYHQMKAIAIREEHNAKNEVDRCTIIAKRRENMFDI